MNADSMQDTCMTPIGTDMSNNPRFEKEEYGSPDLDLSSDKQGQESIVSDDSSKAQLLLANGMVEGEFIGKTFPRWQDAESFYNEYAKIKGFSIRKEDVKKNKEKLVISRTWVCSREGCRRAHRQHYDRSREPKALTRVGCTTRFRVSYDELLELYCVKLFRSDHNHSLASIEDVHFLRSHRRVSGAAIAQASGLKRVGMRVSEVMNYQVLQSGGYEMVGYTRRDLYNRMLEEKNRKLNDGDAEGALGYLAAKSRADPEFFCKYDVDEEHRMRRMFWADGISRSDYDLFGDVLVFYATYRTNAYRQPLVVMCGVNNHYQTVIFGCALLGDEKTSSYEWVLDSFLEAMRGKVPTSVITDDCRAMGIAVFNKLPSAVHRLCSWHLGRNANKNVKVKGFSGRFSYLMNKNCDESEFETLWQGMVEEFGVSDREWVKTTYEGRMSWARSYLRAVFFANQTSSQRCESMHSSLKLHLGEKLRLYEFVEAYDFALTRIRNDVAKARANCEHTQPSLNTSIPALEEHAASVYTREVFYRVREELKDALSVILESKSVTARDVTYVVGVYEDASKSYTVIYTPSTLCLKCSCMSFDYCGWPCVHMFFVMKSERMSKIPPSCINRRWTIEAHSTAAQVEHSSLSTASLQMARFGSLTSACSNLAYYASHSSIRYEEARTEICRMEDHFKELYTKDREGVPTDVLPGGKTFNIRDPEVLPKRRALSDVARVSRMRRCGRCRCIGHAKNKCPKITSPGAASSRYTDAHISTPSSVRSVTQQAGGHSQHTGFATPSTSHAQPTGFATPSTSQQAVRNARPPVFARPSPMQDQNFVPGNAFVVKNLENSFSLFSSED